MQKNIQEIVTKHRLPTIPQLQNFSYFPSTNTLYFISPKLDLLTKHQKDNPNRHPGLLSEEVGENVVYSINIPKDGISIEDRIDFMFQLDTDYLNWHLSASLQIYKNHEQGNEKQKAYSANIEWYHLASTHLYFYTSEDILYRQSLCEPFELEIILEECLYPKIEKDYISFIRRNDLWIFDLKTRNLEQLTKSQSVWHRFGMPTFIQQEEFHLYEGYHWQPKNNIESVNRIICLESNDEKIENVEMIYLKDGHVTVDEVKYPFAGTLNSECQLVLIEFTPLKRKHLYLPRLKNSDREESTLERNVLKKIFDYEYLLDFGFTPNNEVYCLLLDRRQRHSWLILIPLDLFTEDPIDIQHDCIGECLCLDQTIDQIKSQITVLVEESVMEGWLTMHHLYHFTNEYLYYVSEESGFMHLYQLNLKTKERRQLTFGEWPISSSDNLSVFDDKIYFMTYKDTYLEKHLYCVDITTGSVTRLTALGMSHSVTVLSHDLFVDTYSSLLHPPTVDLLCIKQDKVHLIGRLWGGSKEYNYTALDNERFIVNSVEFRVPKSIDYQSEDGQLLKAFFFQSLLPVDKGPLLLYVYHGPSPSQPLIQNGFTLHYSRIHLLLIAGIHCLICESRGGSSRGKQFESVYQKGFGIGEVADIMNGFEALKRHSLSTLVDWQRVTVHGWSYGGFLSIKLLMLYPDIFSKAVSGAPVTDWHLYDTGYTERYLGLLPYQQSLYQASSLFSYLHLLPPNLKERLLIVHGIEDDNVLFRHSQLFTEKLESLGNGCLLRVFNGEKHGLRRSGSIYLFEVLLLELILK